MVSLQQQGETCASLLEAASATWLFTQRELDVIAASTSAAGDDHKLTFAADNFESKMLCIANDSLMDGSSRAQLTELNRCSTAIGEVGGRVNKVADDVLQLKHQYETVSAKTSALHDACDELMSDQTRLAAVAEDIRSKLSYYEPVDNIMQKLNSPHLVVTSEAFTRLLTTIDENTLFLKHQTDCKEAEAYLLKYQQCLSRALSLVKSFMSQKLQETVEKIRAQLQQLQTDGDLSSAKSNSGLATTGADDAFTMFYGVFATHAQTIRILMGTLEAKYNTAEEYSNVMQDCYSLYFSHRDSLMRDSVKATVLALGKQHSNSTCALTRAGCSFLIRLCDDEYRLFYQFFTRPTDLLHVLSDFTERMCLIVYDSLRPTIIHLPHLETLAEVCTIIRVEMIENRCSDADVSEQYVGFVRMAQSLSGDIGERLMYRALMYAQSDIQNYKPAPGDLAYPEKLIMMQEIASKSAEKDTPSVVGLPPVPVNPSEQAAQSHRGMSAVDLHALWYPSVRRTILCLSKIYKCLDETVFVGVSQEVLSLCVQSLLQASDQIIAKDSKRNLDAQLFVIKHLLILRDQTSPFRVSAMANQSVKDTQLDFHKWKESARSVMGDRSRWFAMNSTNSFLELLVQVPVNTTEHVADGRRTVDLQLRESCQKLIAYSSHRVIGDVLEFIRKADVVLELGKEKQQAVQLSTQPFAQCKLVQDLVADCYRRLRHDMPLLNQKLQLYIANVDTENILLQPVKKKIFDAMAQLRFLVTSEYTEEQQQIIALPSNEQLNLTFVK